MLKKKILETDETELCHRIAFTPEREVSLELREAKNEPAKAPAPRESPLMLRRKFVQLFKRCFFVDALEEEVLEILLQILKSTRVDVM